MGWFIGFLAIGVVALGRRVRSASTTRAGKRVPRPEINRWEEEGGAVPGDLERPLSNDTLKIYGPWVGRLSGEPGDRAGQNRGHHHYERHSGQLPGVRAH